MTRDELIEAMARAACLIVADRDPNKPHYDRFGVATGKLNWQAYTGDAKLLLATLESKGMAVVPVDRMRDYFAEVEAAITSVQGALRHYKQPQDVHFHLALKACRDGSAMLSAGRVK